MLTLCSQNASNPGSANTANSQNSPDSPDSKNEMPVAVLVDDDALVRLLWKNAAKSAQKVFFAFADPDELFQKLALIDPRTPIYIDSDLGGLVRGEDVALQLYTKGFKELYLATGYETDQFPSMPWIKKIVGKEPPAHLFKKRNSN